MPGGKPLNSTPQSSSPGPAVGALVTFFARAAAVVFALALAYQLYAIFGGVLKSYPAGYNVVLSHRLSHNMDVAATAVMWSAAALTVCAVALWWGWEWAWFILLVMAAVMYAGFPYVAVPRLSAASLDYARPQHPGLAVLSSWRIAGGAFGLGAALFILGWAWDQLRVSLAAPRRTGGLRVPFYSACWQTHYCKEEINKLCEPGRKGYRKSCWRYKSGCFCDESIADKMLAQARKGAGEAAEKFFGPRAKAPAPTLSDRFRSTYHRAPNQKIACARCPIYNYHEIQKHRILAPLVLLAVPALMYYFSDALHTGYLAVIGWLDAAVLHLAFTPNSTSALQRQIHGALDVPGMEWMVFAVICLLLITTAARALEWWCFEAKL